MTNLIYSCIYYNMSKMKRAAVILAVILSSIIAGFLIFNLGFATARYAADADEAEQALQLPATPASILEAVNAERAKVGVAPLAMNQKVKMSAQLKADDMWVRDYRGHFLPDGDGATLTPQMAALVEPICSRSGENFVYNQENSPITTEQSISWWMSSPPHKKAILDPKYTLTGIGVANDSIVVQHFCVAR